MSILLQDILNQQDDFCANYAVGTIDKGNKVRAANRAIEYIQRRLGLPSDKQIFTFNFYDDTVFYDCPDGFNELLKIYYNNSSLTDQDHNVNFNSWERVRDIDLLGVTGQPRANNKIAFTTINGKNQLMLVGSNFLGSSTINDFDSTSGLVFTSDFTTSIDTNVKKHGTGSLKFNLTNAFSVSTITMSGTFDISTYLNINSAYRMYVYFPTGGAAQFTNIELRLQSSVGNYYSILATTQFDGTAWTENAWNLLSFSLSDVTTVGSPDATKINSTIINLNHSGTFSSISNMRLDFLYQTNPDLMNVIFYSAYKGTDTTGATKKVILDQNSDICAFGAYAPDLLYPIALKGTELLAPQLRADDKWKVMYKSDFEDVLKIFGRIYPRERQTGNMGETQLKR